LIDKNRKKFKKIFGDLSEEDIRELFSQDYASFVTFYVLLILIGRTKEML